MDKARFAAVSALVRMHGGGFANLTAKSMFASLSPRDMAFASALFYGTAERVVTLDALLAANLKQSIPKLDVEIRAILETGLYQILYMDIPARAAVDEAVNLARAFKKSSAAGFVNAVLRKSQNASLDGFQFESERHRVQVTWSVSAPVANAVMQALPQSYDAFFESSFHRPGLCLRVNTLTTTVEDVTEQIKKNGGDVIKAGAPPACLYVQLSGGVATDPLFLRGQYHVQGEASQVVCANVKAKKGMRVLDICAAPGGKTATLAQYMRGGNGLTACDVRENRIPLIGQTLERLGIEGVQVLHNDAATYTPALRGQDAVLCDVPCSGLGVLAKKPDIRYALGDTFDSLPELQLRILSTAARYVHSGGRLVYSTCTIRPQENEQVVQAFLAQNKDFNSCTPVCVPAGACIDNNMVTMLPQFTALDGFFVATLERL